MHSLDLSVWYSMHSMVSKTYQNKQNSLVTMAFFIFHSFIFKPQTVQAAILVLSVVLIHVQVLLQWPVP